MTAWADGAIEALRSGRAATVRPRGRSMAGRVEDGQVVPLEPTSSAGVLVGDVVLVRVRGRVLLHLVRAADGRRYQIGNNRGGVNGWVGPDAVYGVAVALRKGRP